jgi:hypothetical protein
LVSVCIGKPINIYRSYRISDIGSPINIPGGEKVMCGIHYQGHYGRHFLTTEEQIEKLEEYKSWLDNESKGVEEAIERLNKAS